MNDDIDSLSKFAVNLSKRLKAFAIIIERPKKNHLAQCNSVGEYPVQFATNGRYNPLCNFLSKLCEVFPCATFVDALKSLPSFPPPSPLIASCAAFSPQLTMN